MASATAAPERASCALLVLCGLPAAGKTSLAQQIVEHAVALRTQLRQEDVAAGAAAPSRQPAVEVVRVTFDDWLWRTGGEGNEPGCFSPDMWQHSRQQALAAVAASAAAPSPAGEVAVAGGRRGDGPPQAGAPTSPHATCQQQLLPFRLVLVDDNMQYRSMRRDVYVLARDRRLAYLQLHVACDLAVALARNAERDGLRRVPPAVLERMAGAFEAPQPGRHGWEAATLTVDTSRPTSSSLAVAQLWDMLWSAWGAAPPLLPTAEELEQSRLEARLAVAASSVHGLDLRTRKLVSEAVAHAAAAERPLVAQRLNAGRKHLLDYARGSAAMSPVDGTCLHALEQSFFTYCMAVVRDSEHVGLASGGAARLWQPP